MQAFTSTSATTLFPNTYEVKTQSLEKRGEYRYVYRLFFKLYDVALFAEADSSSSDILSAEVPFHLSFNYLRTIDKSIILESADTILDRNLSNIERQQIADRVDLINAAYQTVREGDRSSLTYLPAEGTTLRINEQPIATIPGKDFAQLYFQIWLGENPISTTMKSVLIGDQK